jgi:hypothetical protein
MNAAIPEWRSCKTHPDVDPNRMWGCPDCVAELRARNLELNRTVELLRFELEVAKKNGSKP